MAQVLDILRGLLYSLLLSNSEESLDSLWLNPFYGNRFTVYNRKLPLHGPIQLWPNFFLLKYTCSKFLYHNVKSVPAPFSRILLKECICGRKKHIWIKKGRYIILHVSYGIDFAQLCHNCMMSRTLLVRKTEL